MIWLLFALISCGGETARTPYIKRNCTQSPHIIVAGTRIISFVFLLVLMPAFYKGMKISEGNFLKFILLILITATLTLAATLIKIDFIQKEELSKISPLFSLTPIFILPWSFLLLGEKITLFAFFGILFSVCGACVILANKKSISAIFNSKFSLMILIMSGIYGFTTVLDKIIIGVSSAYTYTLVWTGVSALLSLYTIPKYSFKVYRKEIVSRTNIIQAGLWTVSFFFQQLAVQYSMHIPMNTAYIKSISYLSIPINIFLGGSIFKEKELSRKILGAVIIITGNLIILFAA